MGGPPTSMEVRSGSSKLLGGRDWPRPDPSLPLSGGGYASEEYLPATSSTLELLPALSCTAGMGRHPPSLQHVMVCSRAPGPSTTTTRWSIKLLAVHQQQDTEKS